MFPPSAQIPGPLGLIRLADDECLCPEGNYRSFVSKLLGEVPARNSTDTASTPADPSITGDVEDGESRRIVAESEDNAWPVHTDPAWEGRSKPVFHIKHFAGDVRPLLSRIIVREDRWDGIDFRASLFSSLYDFPPTDLLEKTMLEA